MTPDWWWASQADMRLIYDAIQDLERALSQKLDRNLKEIKAMGVREDANWDRLVSDLNKIVAAWVSLQAELAAVKAALATADADKAAALEADSEVDADKVAAADAIIAALVADPEIPVEAPPADGS